MRARLRERIGVACAAVLTVSGCASAGAGPASQPPGAVVTYECTWHSEGGEVLLGETISVSRGPEGACEGLELGASQVFELRSNYADDDVTAIEEVDVGEDGSFAFEIRVPDGLRIGRAVLQAVPNEPGCDDPQVLDCPPPAVNFTVRHPASALRDVGILTAGLEAPALPEESIGSRSFYLPGPREGEVTLVIIGSGCETLPRSYVATAASDSLEIVSEVRGDTCNDMATPWTTVIQVPEEYAGFTSVKVDNVPAVELPPNY